jgi:hypothetical protein
MFMFCGVDSRRPNGGAYSRSGNGRKGARRRVQVAAAGLCMAIVIAGSGCGAGKPTIITVTRPTQALYDHRAKCGRNPSKSPNGVCPSHFDLRGLLGLSLTAATARAKEHALRIRVVERDGHGLIVYQDELSNRVDVAVVDGIVTVIRRVG